MINRVIDSQLEREKWSALKKMQFSSLAEAWAVSKHWIFRGERPELRRPTALTPVSRRRAASRSSACTRPLDTRINRTTLVCAAKCVYCMSLVWVFGTAVIDITPILFRLIVWCFEGYFSFFLFVRNKNFRTAIVLTVLKNNIDIYLNNYRPSCYKIFNFIV